jgi:hypothetical protein
MEIISAVNLERRMHMFWTGIIIGIFIGAAAGILIMSMAVSAGSRESECYLAYQGQSQGQSAEKEFISFEHTVEEKSK